MIEYYKDSSPVVGPEGHCQSVKMDPVNVSAISCNFTAHFSGNSSSCAQSNRHPSIAIPNPYEEFFKLAFGSAIYILTVSLITIMANGLLLLVFFFDPLKIFRNATTYFLVGLAVVDILTAATQEPAYATCFIMMYARHPDTRYIYEPQTIECWTDHLYSFDELLVSFRARIYFHTICCCDFPSELRSKCNEKASYYLRLSYLCVQRIVQRVAGDGSFWRRATIDWQYISLHMLDIFYRNYLHPSFYRF